jgi:phage tail-like protein
VADETAAENGRPATFGRFAGAGFGTVQIESAAGSDPPPTPVSTRRYLRDNLPGIYSDGDFGMRFVRALEELLDPLVAVLDNLTDHFDPSFAPRDILDLLTDWLGLEHDEARSVDDRRRILLMAPELMRRRGTRAGLQLELDLAFPGVPFRVEDGGSVTWSLDANEPDGDPGDAPSFVVYCDIALPDAKLKAVARLIERCKPAHVNYRLRVRTSGSRDRG